MKNKKYWIKYCQALGKITIKMLEKSNPKISFLPKVSLKRKVTKLN